MWEFLSQYGMFLAQSVTVVLAIVITVIGIVSTVSRARRPDKGHIEVKSLNEHFDDLKNVLLETLLDKAELKQHYKDEKKRYKNEQAAKKAQTETKPRVFVLNFHGDMRAQAVSSLREEISAVLSVAGKNDEVVVRLESSGGMVHSYGLAASQLARITSKGLALTACVDKVAASGGYMMACVANRVIAAPFAILGSIGVIAQLPNFNRLLKKHDIDFEMITAGEYKRTLTMLGENTDAARRKFTEELEDTHVLFKNFVTEHRPQVDIEQVATGEIWFGQRAIEKKLVDEIETSDSYLMRRSEEAELYEVTYVERKSFQQKLGLAAEESADRLLMKWWQKSQGRELIS